MLMLNGHDVRVCEARLRQVRAQLAVPSTFDMVEATQVVELYTSFGVVQVPLPAGEFIVGMEDPAGVRRFGVVRFEGIPDDEGWHVD
ncbi:hypothetical protein ACTJJX_02500 [Pseudomonas sp. 22490]|uniref:hypothetical protein n=1 Tax=Pseudomonas sp. 22490 TaxID=3453929 RepID=UPI003F864BEB